jgi:shikimate kinase
MKLSLIGTSGTGKSYWAEKLAREQSFTRFCIDDLIELKLAADLSKENVSGINGVANWMGMPYEQHYKENEGKYLTAERNSMNEVLKKVKQIDFESNVVIDTTGSVIYMGDAICQELHSLTTVVYFDVSEEFEEKMFNEFVSNPKPIIWGDSYKKINGESPMESLHRCYPELLHYRSTLYKQYADIIIPYEVHKESGLSSNGFMELIQKK